MRYEIDASTGRRIGPRMRAVEEYVRAFPGRPMIHAAGEVGPRGSMCYGYRTVHRAIEAGLVRTEPGPCGSTLLCPWEE